MTTDGMSPQPEVRSPGGSVVGGGACVHQRERQEAATPTLDQSALKTSVEEILNRWPAVGLALGVVRDGSLVSFYGHGAATVPAFHVD